MNTRRLFFVVILIVSGTRAYTQSGNVGIGTATPGSKLTVAGSMAGGYTAVTANTYTILDNDYYIVWNQTTVPALGFGIFALPAAALINKGRIYKIKNTSTTYSLAINNTGSVLIDNLSTLYIPPSYSVEIIANGNTAASTTCWEVVNMVPVKVSDGIRNALAGGGCTSCTAYDAANPDTWLQITSAEYSAILSGITGMGAYFATATQMSTNSTTGWSAGFTATESFSNQSQLPAANYPVAMSIRTGTSAPGTMLGVKMKLSSTSQSSGYADVPISGATTPNIAGSPASNTIYYYVLKRPTQQSALGVASNIAVYTPVLNQIGTGLSGNCLFGVGDVSNPGASNSSNQLVQILSTPNKQW